MPSSLPLFLVLGLVATALGGFRCRFGSGPCVASCVALGQTSGICDDDGECICSEKAISISNLKKLLPSRCNLGLSFCMATCNALGRQDGTCDDNDCECGDLLSPKEFALCAVESTCRLDCQRQGSGTGQCFGWSCKCLSSKDAAVPAELQELQ